ncbi:N-acetyl-gamma-glutamyl-phosphate reductase, C-terminal part [Ectocarpus siliculosus]|uniref:N-acetyl-gamma-glutamyl-phosphate reductase n=1 Tax=Ectocarpus siliculosus TaxID=2880 RepID=D8LSF8_ECTSI|nr:N-acetyl-gamma-glutamyl-phosphate reductase, C-terminal part [Ectocarpus siliculosus]|eukprot:CBN75215.1 N-acetyl-gamma-glutamyl-phosphate reductase, C-terminal part [Ectocarpus siliculosus]
MGAAGAETKPVRVAILGASGYTGAELVRLLLGHTGVEITVLTGNTQAGQEFSAVYPQFHYAKDLPALTRHEDHDWKDVDCVFCCLPHATTQEIISQLPEHLKIVDLSADFRLKDIETYAEWYGGEHKAPALQAEAVYGLTELARDDVRGARLVANPGCYPTAAQLPLIALLKAGLILKDDIIIDAKSGTTGAGRAPKQGTLFCEVSDGINAYGVASHRHAPEIEQGLGEACGSKDVVVNFTPHLMPMSRGILETIYVKLADGSTVEEAKAALEKAYAGERFVTVLPGAAVPHTRHVRGSNHVFMNIVADRLPGRAVILVSMDNLVKGASGQAIQNMNVMFDLPETQGVDMAPMFP